ncbi:MAG: alkaline phosphatase family protein [Candidatus Freyarchaeota archaeon]|nr:alkaline phosphatase family protein [Candidatus Jordarchaeia archaeon]
MGDLIVEELKKGCGLYRPNYKQNIFSVIPTAMSLLGVEPGRPTLLSNRMVKRCLEEAYCFDVDKVVCIVADSVDVRQLPLFEKLYEAWCLLGEPVLSSVFPTVTSSAIVSIHSGLPPERHGIVGHKVWFQQLGTVVDTLKMASIRAPSMDRLVKSGVDVRVLLLENCLYRMIEGTGVAHVEIMPSSIARTGLSHILGAEDVTVEFENLVDAFSTLRSVLDKYVGRKTLINVYFDLTDAISHKYGPLSEEYRLTAHHVEEVFLHFLKHSGNDDKVAFMFFSDHGQEEVSEEKTVKVSEDEAEVVLQYLRSPPGRSGRVIHFYVKDGKEDDVRRWVEEKVGENGLLMSFDDVCKFFSLKPKGKLRGEVRSRMGDFVLVMNAGAELKFQRKEEKEKLIEEKWRGSHGSMILNELLVPLVAARADILKGLLGLGK